MKISFPLSRVLFAGMAVSAAAAASAQPVINGVRDAAYGAPQWANTDNPTGFGDNNYAPNPGCPATSGAGVTTGIEFSVPLAQIGNPAANQIRFTAIITSGGYDFASNQVVGGIPPQRNLAETRAINFNTPELAGNQFVSGIATVATAPVIDGTLDAAYGAPLWIQNLGTGFGDNSDPSIDRANGSELNGAYAVVSGDRLYIFLTGNLETNFNKLSIFIDTNPATGQQTLRSDNPNVDFNGLNRMGEGPQGPGLTFDTGFRPNYWFGITTGNSPAQIFVNGAELLTDGGGSGSYLGSTVPGSSGVLDGGNPFNVLTTINNSNVGGVDGCTPGGPSGRDFANGSEINALYATKDDTYLYLLITGNLQTNFTKLDLFFDVRPGGQNTLRNDNVNIDFGGLNRLGGQQICVPIDPADPACEGVTDFCGNPGLCPVTVTFTSGLTFDTGFAADYFIGITNGSDPVQQYVNAAVLRTPCSIDPTPPCGPNQDILGNALDYSSFDGGVKTLFDPVSFPGTDVDRQADPFVDPENTLVNLEANAAPRLIGQNPFNPEPLIVPGLILMSMDNSNLAGITADSASQAAAAAVTTGIELRIRLDELGWDGVSPIRVAGLINNDGRSFASNQVLGGLPAGTPNLGEPSAINFSAIAGTQFVTLNFESQGADCNDNGIPDAQEIAANPSLDCYSAAGAGPGMGGPDGILDQCQCVANWNRDGAVNTADITAYLSTWFADRSAGTTAGDVNCDGVVNTADITSYLSLWFAARANPAGANCPQ